MNEIIKAESQALSIARAEIDQQVATAKQFPRDIAACRDELVATVTLDLDTAESCLYSLPRDGKSITGPSVRLAEMAVSSWGNIRAGWRLIETADKTVTCEGICHDMQKNVVNTATASRSIWGKRGRYGEHMIQTTTMACGAIAYRNAVYKTIPAALIKSALDGARQKVVTEVGDYKPRLTAMVEAFGNLGADPAKVCAYFGVDEIEQMTAQQFLDAMGIHNAIKQGSAQVSDYFGAKPRRQAEAGVSLDDLDATKEGAE